MKWAGVQKWVALHCCPFYTTYPINYHQHSMQLVHPVEAEVLKRECTLVSVDSRTFVPEIQRNWVPSTNADNFQFLSYKAPWSCDRLYFRLAPEIGTLLSKNILFWTEKQTENQLTPHRISTTWLNEWKTKTTITNMVSHNLHKVCGMEWNSMNFRQSFLPQKQAIKIDPRMSTRSTVNFLWLLMIPYVQ